MHFSCYPHHDGTHQTPFRMTWLLCGQERIALRRAHAHNIFNTHLIFITVEMIRRRANCRKIDASKWILAAIPNARSNEFLMRVLLDFGRQSRDKLKAES